MCYNGKDILVDDAGRGAIAANTIEHSINQAYHPHPRIISFLPRP